MPGRIAFVLAATDVGPMIVNRFDRAEYPDGRPFGVGHQLLETASYEAAQTGQLATIVGLRRRYGGDGVVAVDIGANIGAFTVPIARAMAGWGRVLAVEAQEHVYYALAGNTALNNLFNVRCLHAAAAASSGRMRIPVLNPAAAASFGSLELLPREAPEDIGQPVDRSPGATVEVASVAVDDLALPRVDLVKLDVEGMEEQVLLGAAATLRAHHPVLFVEWIKSDKARLVARMEELGYVTREVGMNILAVHRSDKVLAHIK